MIAGFIKLVPQVLTGETFTVLAVYDSDEVVFKNMSLKQLAGVMAKKEFLDFYIVREGLCHEFDFDQDSGEVQLGRVCFRLDHAGGQLDFGASMRPRRACEVYA